MKNLLIATTALVATAGMAAAEINFSGGARFGVTYDESLTPGVEETKVHNRFTINIDGTAETDAGVEFFGRVRIRGENEGDGTTRGTAASSVSAPRVGARIGGLTIAVGNINGAIDGLAGVYSGIIGLTGLSFSNVVNNNQSGGTFGFDSFSSGGAGTNGVEVIYSGNGFKAHLSDSATTNRTALGLSYAFGDWTVALGHQSSDTAGEDFTSIGVDGSIGTASVGAAYAANEGDFDTFRINAGFEVGAATNVTVYVADNSGAGRETAYGVGFTHSLGGATLAGGIENDRAGLTRADFGVRFNF